MKLARTKAFTLALPIVLYLIFVFVFFAGPLTGHGSLSKAHMLAEWDSLFDAQRTGQSILMDPSLLYLMIPGYLLKARLIHAGELPLWNPYTGLGAPLVGDPQSLAFSPLHLPLLLSPTMGMLSVVLALEVAVLGVSTYMLARALKLSVFASTFAMMIASMCPYHLYYLELLGNGFCMVPLAFWMIIRLSGESILGRLKCAWLSALGLACCIYSAHVEMSFFAITLACVVKLLITLSDKNARQETTAAALNIAMTGAFTLLLSAPLLFPFVEFVKNSECYKFGSGAPAIIPWQAMLYNMLSPGYGGASPTLGPVVLPLIILALCQSKLQAKARAIAFVALAAIVIMTKLGPLETLFGYAPFSFIVVTYALPSALVLLSILSAIGLDKAIEPDTGKKHYALVLAISAVLGLLLFPQIAGILHLPLSAANFDLCVGNYAFNKADITRYSIVALLFAAALTWHKLKTSKTTAIVLGAVCISSYLALIVVARRSMPTWPKFAYAQTAAIDILQRVTGEERCIATGSHLFRSNTNSVYNLRDLRAHNPLFPKRFLAMLKLCGAKIDTFSQEFDSPLSAALDLCSIKAVASQTPVTDCGALPETKSSTSHPVRLLVSAPAQSCNLDIKLIAMIYDKKQRAIFATITGAASDHIRDNINYLYGLTDARGTPLWFADQAPLAKLLAKEPVMLTIPVPQKVDSGTLTIQFFDTSKNAFVKLQNSPALETRDYLALAAFDQSTTTDKLPESAYTLAGEADHIRIYQNANALPRAYWCGATHLAKDSEDALAYLQSKSFEPRREIVLEPETGEVDTLPLQNGRIKAATFIEDRTKKVVLDVDAPEQGYVVLNDIWYPGWQASVDGAPAYIRHANYAMRAVPVERGRHKVIFEYKPTSFKLGAVCLLLALLAGALLQLLSRRKAAP